MEMPDLDFSYSIPDSPPPEALEEVDAAWERSAAFARGELELHVRVGRISGRLSADLRMEDVRLARLTPSQILALACGEPVAGILPPG
jgi:hypothetical protein